MKPHLYTAFLTCFGLGNSIYAPGTVGALGGAALYLLVSLTGEPTETLLLAALIFVWSAGTIACGPWAERQFGKKDAQCIVSDEVAGLLLVLLLFRPFESPGVNLLWAFPLTRMFDILKFPPARQLEHLPHGWGVLCDDLMSALYTAGALHLLYFAYGAFLPAT